MIFEVTAIIMANAHVGEVEADSFEEAEEKAAALLVDLDTYQLTGRYLTELTVQPKETTP